ncbi:MAG: universal stress protein [Trebonia sp.]|jgi:nucleotide-binding universal stress UspA family protein
MGEREHRIVVGVDGSEPSMAALRWAIRQAALTGACVDAVAVWRYPTGYGWAPSVTEIDFEGDAKRSLAEALGAVGTLGPEVRVRPLVAEGQAAEVLLRAATGADLLVVGSRGHGALTSPLLGSVSLNCVLHAHCPVLVLRGGHEGS